MKKINARSPAPRGDTVAVGICGPRTPGRHLTAEEQASQENATAAGIRTRGYLTSRGGPSPERTLGEGRRR